ncbi:P-loop NTPase fold protein [Granulicella sp. S156]|uniref:KAP family P-loop NTPase fold protein n=1 Tax=Granulicella sp. S156 TaxID=1747224 RepID=UPI00131DFECD|nr:P-loop NTPase fold protein [Granulicella sp. S156]
MDKKDKPLSSTDWLSSDRPIDVRSEDLLDRRGFAEALATAIREWSGRDSLVIALYGAWGNGKSSIKNMMIDYLSETAPSLRVFDFNPWQRANRPQLSAAFFDELGIALGKGDLGTNESRKKTLNRYRRWASRLRGGQEIVNLLRHTISTIFMVCALVLLSTGLLQSRALSVVAGLLAFFIGLLSFSTKLVNATIAFFEAGVDTGAKSLTEVKTELAADLQKMKTPILAVLDDLDRLTPEELLEVFQLIKANGDFPNLIYLVLCDRKIVENSISESLKLSGRDYLEKVVQVAFDVPMIDADRVRSVLFQGLDLLLAKEGVSKRFDRKRWGNVFFSGLNSYFATLRDVNRFLSTLAFHISLLSVEGAFEVNPIDLIVLETMRLFEPDVYASLQANKSLLTTSRSEGGDASVAKKALNSIVSLGQNTHQNQLIALVKHLFPTVEWAFDGPNYAQDYGSQWYRDLRVCSRKVFDRYFRLAISGGELPQATISRLLDARGDRQELRSELEALFAQGLGNLAMEELGVYQDDLESLQVEPYITAIFDIGDSISDENRTMFDVPASWRAGFLVDRALEKLQDLSVRISILRNSMHNTLGLFLPLQFLDQIAAENPNDGAERLIPESDLINLKDTIGLQKIRDAADSGVLADHPKVGRLLHMWRERGQPEAAAKYADEMTQKKAGMLRFLESFVLRSTRQGISDHVGEARRYIRSGEINSLVPVATIESRLGLMSLNDISESESVAVKAFEKAMERRKAGKSDEDPRTWN